MDGQLSSNSRHAFPFYPEEYSNISQIDNHTLKKS